MALKKEAIKVLNIIIPAIPVIDFDNPFGSFSVSDLTEERKQTHEYDNAIANFLLRGGFVTQLLDHRFMSEYDESRTLELTIKGIKLVEVGSYQEYIGLFLLIVLKLFKLDLYYWWVYLSKGKKDTLIAVLIGIAAAALIEFVKWLFEKSHT